jgi:hypothetical protein
MKASLANMVAVATTGYCVLKAASSIASQLSKRKVTTTQNPLDERVDEIADLYTGSDYGMSPGPRPVSPDSHG